MLVLNFNISVLFYELISINYYKNKNNKNKVKECFKNSII